MEQLSTDAFRPISNEEFENGPQYQRPGEPPKDEQLRYIAKVLLELGAVNPNNLASTIQPLTTWEGDGLRIDGEPIQRWIRNYALTHQSAFRSGGVALRDYTLKQADLASDASLLSTAYLKEQFAALYGEARLREIETSTNQRRLDRIEHTRADWLAGRQAERNADMQEEER